MKDKKIAALYKKYLLGELSPQENTIFLDLLTSCDPDELPELEEVIALVDRSCDLNKSISDDIFYAITGAELCPKVQPIWKRRWASIAVAASLLLVAFVGLFYLLFESRPARPDDVFMQYSNSTKFVKRLTLSDGTRISLRQGGQIDVLSDFRTDSLRKIRLSGEAFFEVAKNPKKAFVIVNSGDFDVRVLGTAFNLICLPQQARLMLNHGKVQVTHDEQHSIIHPGQQVAYDVQHQQFKVSAVDTVAASTWKSDLLSFNQIPLAQIVDDLNNLYPDQNLQLIDSFQMRSFTGYLPASDLEKSLKILNTAFNQTIIHKK